MKHPKNVEGFDGTLEELAGKVGNLRYDSVEEFIGYLADNFTRQADEDYTSGRKDLAERLDPIIYHLDMAKVHIGEVWIFCEPRMKDE